ncbi:MAG: DUF302 domain-containing protein [Bacteroidota bacterium]|nr:DUF302 domain-containing protein [Bacteroidota bacterium]
MEINQFISEQESPLDFEKTVESIKAVAEQKDWKIPAVHDLQQSIAKSGKHVKPVTVVEICKPEYSGQMLELNHERIISIMMPCRISVYEKDDGKTYVALLNTAAMAVNIPQHLAEVMKAAADESSEIVKTALSQQ